ncbi:glycerophosphodiester phosphodiesterase [Staphylococcus sp. 17KM0847]|uniref:glycerophosphodiester phosphodiesterase n=1 Tax=Staphylococcus sp. 17KM0847 TaxID=2583989 RepID=UPI0015DD4E07|nr:glycerophosphodiester phosphodiesterase [Staphylococcus sp. 17KM0847]QLK85761.1 glycerophosphodiester phosphodiesterase [Staphylococcus sp. 17KM0847]
MTKTRYILISSIIGVSSVISSMIYMIKKQQKQQKRMIKPFFKHSAPYVLSHRGGMQTRPESTQLAFDYSASMNLTGFETDIRLTKDEAVIVFHDATIDRTTNGSGFVSHYTLAELQALDAGYHFTDINGHHPYRGHPHAKIMTMDTLLQKYPDQLVNIDIKDHPNTYEGKVAAKRLYDIIKRNHAESRVLVTSFYKKQIDRFNSYNNGEIATGASQAEVTDGILKHLSGLGLFYTGQAHTFQMPTKYKGIPLTQPKLIQWLNSQNIAPCFYGVNKIDQMTDLVSMGVHTLVTDSPEIGKQFLSLHH